MCKRFPLCGRHQDSQPQGTEPLQSRGPCRTVYLRWWSAARGLHRKPRSHFFFFHCTDRTSDTTLNDTTTGSSLMTPPLLAVCQRAMNRNAEESLLTLWTKEVVIGFCRTSTLHIPVNIQGLNIEVAESFKYVGVYFENTDALYQKGQSCLHLLQC